MLRPGARGSLMPSTNCDLKVSTSVPHPKACPKWTRQQPWGAAGGALNTVEREAMYKGVEQLCQQG